MTDSANPSGRNTLGQNSSRKRRVLHVSGDFPDTFEAAKTPVIRSLVDLTADQFDHQVVSLNRRSPTAREAITALNAAAPPESDIKSFDYGEAWRYPAPGGGIMHRTMLQNLGKRIANRFGSPSLRPDLLIGHKLTIEGIAVQVAAHRVGVPYALSIQGNTDLKILAVRPDLRSLFARIFHGAAVVFPFAPWALRDVEALLGKRKGPTRILPCPTDLDEAMKPRITGGGLVSVFHLRNFRGKNLAGLVSAYRLISQSGRMPPPLDIIGGGTDADFAACRKMCKDFPQIQFVGPLTGEALRQRINSASALIVPSLRETFGLVFVEALFAGTPIIYPKGAGVDGYFDSDAFALAVDARDPHSIALGIEQSVACKASMKAKLEEWQCSDRSTLFTRAKIGQRFAEGIREAFG